MLDRHLFIIGMPGSGKSSLGKRLAKETGFGFADTDEMIEAAAGGTVSDFFAKYGEENFRRAETNILIRLTRRLPMIISTGGGMAVRAENRAIMRNSGYILLLDRPLADIMDNIRLEKRPLLREKGLPELERLYAERIPIYRSIADYILVNRDYHKALQSMIALIKEL